MNHKLELDEKEVEEVKEALSLHKSELDMGAAFNLVNGGEAHERVVDRIRTTEDVLKKLGVK